MNNPVETWDVCQDCLDVRYNSEFEDGFIEDGVDYTAAVIGWKRINEFCEHEYPGKIIHIEEVSGGYDEFSWRRCECCGSTLGGSRFKFGLYFIGEYK